MEGAKFCCYSVVRILAFCRVKLLHEHFVHRRHLASCFKVKAVPVILSLLLHGLENKRDDCIHHGWAMLFAEAMVPPFHDNQLMILNQ